MAASAAAASATPLTSESCVDSLGPRRDVMAAEPPAW